MLVSFSRAAFLVPFFGALPSYFPFWAKSCEINSPHFHWFVYSDQIRSRRRVNRAVTLIPYQFDEMTADLNAALGIEITGHDLRRVCDYRLYFYWIRREAESLDQFDFIGFTDVDMVYGDLMNFMPENMADYAMISGDDGLPCGPFTLMRRSDLHRLKAWEGMRSVMEASDHHAFDESLELRELLCENSPFHCQAQGLQPGASRGMNSRHLCGLWRRGRVWVYDCWMRRREGGFYHFSRHKNRARFKVDGTALKDSAWGISKFGIGDSETGINKLKMLASLYV